MVEEVNFAILAADLRVKLDEIKLHKSQHGDRDLPREAGGSDEKTDDPFDQLDELEHERPAAKTVEQMPVGKEYADDWQQAA